MNLFKSQKKAVTFSQFAQALYAAAAASVLLVYAYAGVFTRYWADDFCFTQSIHESGNILSATLNIYQSWSNRYTTVLLVGISEWFGYQAISYLPAVLITLWVLGLTLFISQIKALSKMPLQPLSSLLAAMLLVFFSILQAPNRFQAVYWRSGSVTYFAPLIFYAFGAAFILRQSHRAHNRWPTAAALAITALIFFLAGGLSETTLAFQIGFLCMSAFFVGMWFPLKIRKATLTLILTALFATLISLVVVFFAPGNSVRLQTMPEHASLPMLVASSLQFSWDFIRESFKSLPIPSFIAFLSALILSLSYFTGKQLHITSKTRSISLWALVLVPLAAFALMVCLIAPSVYVYGKYGYPEARALFPTRFLMTAAIFTEGVLLGWIASHWLKANSTAVKWLVAAAILVSSLYPIWSAQKELATIPVDAKYAQTWDLRDEKIRAFYAQNILDVKLDGIESPGSLVDLNSDPDRWINRCVAGFYNLHSIAVFEK